MDEDEEKPDVSMDVEANATQPNESINDIAKLESSPEVSCGMQTLSSSSFDRGGLAM